MIMTHKDKLTNFALGIGALLNPALAAAQMPATVWGAIGEDFSRVGKYLYHGVEVMQVELKDAQSGGAADADRNYFSRSQSLE